LGLARRRKARRRKSGLLLPQRKSPDFLLAAYGKSEKENLSKSERNAMAKLVPSLIENYSERSRRKQ